MNQLRHRTVFTNPSRVAIALPLVESLKEHHHLGASFPLVEDPLVTKKAHIIAMFVLRPAIDNWTKPLLDEDSTPRSMYGVNGGWSFNFNGLDGGWLIANGSAVDAFRLALQYGISDAVIVGSNVVSTEGCDTFDEHGELTKPGYLWQPYGPCNWGHLKAADCNLEEKITQQRNLWRDMGYISKRKYPANIVVTYSGAHFLGANDFLDGSIFKATHPDGSPLEVYIITSKNGAIEIRRRIQADLNKFSHLVDRLNDILVELPAENDDTGDSLDLSRLPHYLFQQLDMKIVNHDGGQLLLRRFCQSGVLPQMNLTLCRKQSLRQVLESSTRLSKDIIQRALNEFHAKTQLFFTTRSASTLVSPANISTDNNGSNNRNTENNETNTDFTAYVPGGIPPELPPVEIIVDDEENVAIVTFDSRHIQDF